jgi:competence protein ComEC
MQNFYVLDVGHGNSAVLIDSDGVIVIDTGPKTALLKFLLDNNIHKIDVLLLSYADRDHIAGVIALLASGQIQFGRVYMNSDATKNSQIWNILIYTLWDAHKKGLLYFEPSFIPHLNGKLNRGEVAIEVLAPNQYIGPGSRDRQGRKLNSIGTVIRLSYKGRPLALLPGDIDQVELENLLEDNADLAAWLMVYPPQGGKPSKCQDIYRPFLISYQ